MKFKPDRKQITWGIVALGVIIAGLIAYHFLYQVHYFFTTGLRNILHSVMAVVFGCIIAYILTPLLNFIENKLVIGPLEKRGRHVRTRKGFRRRLRSISITLSIIIFVLVIVSLFVMIIPQFVESIRSVVENLPLIYNNINQFYNEHISAIADPEVNQTVSSTLYSAYMSIDSFLENTLLPQLTSILQSVSKSAIQFVRMIVNFIIGIVVAVYLLNSKERLCAQAKKLTYAFFKESLANEIIGEFRYIHYTFTGFFVGKIIDSIIIGILCYIGSSILRIPYALLVSILVGVTNVIPFFGPYIGMIIGSILILLIDPLHALYFFIFVIVLQQVDGNIIGPMILGQSTGISGFWVIFAILFFGGIFGISGWLIGVPLLAVIMHLVARMTRHMLREKKLSENTDDYTSVAYIENGQVHELGETGTDKYYSQKPMSTFRKLFGRKKREQDDPDKDNKA